MAALLSVNEICERALRKIGAYSINDTAADPEELDETSIWLDMMVGELTAVERCTWLVPDTLDKTLTASTASYVLKTLLGTDYPADGVLFITDAYITDDDSDTLLKILTRKQFEDIADKTTTGKPEKVYIDRLAPEAEREIFFYPVPGAGTTYTVRLVLQKHSADLTVAPLAVKRHGFTRAWQLFLVLALSAYIGSGPVRRLPKEERDDMKRDATDSLAKLQASFNVEVFQPQRVKAYGV